MVKKRSDTIITIHDAEEMKEQIKFLVNFDHTDNPYFDSSESKVAKRILGSRRTCTEEFNRIKRLENDLFS